MKRKTLYLFLLFFVLITCSSVLGEVAASQIGIEPGFTVYDPILDGELEGLWIRHAKRVSYNYVLKGMTKTCNLYFLYTEDFIYFFVDLPELTLNISTFSFQLHLLVNPNGSNYIVTTGTHYYYFSISGTRHFQVSIPWYFFQSERENYQTSNLNPGWTIRRPETYLNHPIQGTTKNDVYAIHVNPEFCNMKLEMRIPRKELMDLNYSPVNVLGMRFRIFWGEGVHTTYFAHFPNAYAVAPESSSSLTFLDFTIGDMSLLDVYVQQGIMFIFLNMTIMGCVGFAYTARYQQKKRKANYKLIIASMTVFIVGLIMSIYLGITLPVFL